MNYPVVNSIDQLLKILRKYRFQFSGNSFADTFIFRGVGNESWALLPSVLRTFSEKQVSQKRDKYFSAGTDIYRTDERQILQHFQKEASSYLPQISASNHFSWMQYAQHYGVPTRLLDFTSNPLIALFFCCISCDDKDGALWIINTADYHNWFYQDSFFAFNGPITDQEIIESVLSFFHEVIEEPPREALPEICCPVLFIPEYIDNRMASQSSRFLLWAKNKDPLEKMVSDKNWMTLSRDGVGLVGGEDSRFLAKVIVPSNFKHAILNQLCTLGVSERTIFPGVEGIGKFIERFHRNHPDDISLHF